MFFVYTPNFMGVHAKIEACIRTVEIPIYQLAPQPFFVSIEVKA